MAAELVAEIEKNIDVDKAKQFFIHITRNDQFKDLDISQNNMPNTLPTLISVVYSSNSDSSLSSEITSNFSLKELSKVVDEDGRICFDQTLSLFAPSSEFMKGEKPLYVQTLCVANAALASYNEKWDAEFELVAPMLSNTFYVSAPRYNYLIHANFLAKPKNTDSSPDLFFAELVACGPSADEVLKCSILTPRLRGSSPVAMTSDFVNIWHPEEVFCHSCDP